MDHREGLLLAWLEGEGERRRRKAPVPPELGYAAWRGRVHVGACALWGRWPPHCSSAGWPRRGSWQPAWAPPRRCRDCGVSGPAWASPSDVRVEGIDSDTEEDDAPEALTLTVRHGDLLIPCEFRAEKSPRGVRVGDVITVRSAGWRVT